jgi:hypothetical protein
MRITNGATRPEAPGEFVTGPTPPSGGWVPSVLLITYRNVPSLPAIRGDSFESIENAIEYVKKVEPTCPRVSLDGRPPEPTPSWGEHLEWLHRLGLRSVAEGDQPRLGDKEGRHPA